MNKSFFPALYLALLVFAVPQASASEQLVGSWSLSKCALKSSKSAEAGSIDASFSVNKEGLAQSSNMMKFESSGEFSSGINLADPMVFAGESLNLKQYKRWNFIPDSVPAKGSAMSGRLEFEPIAKGFEYTVSLSADNILVLTVKEQYKAKSRTTAEGFVTKSGLVPMVYTLTFVPTPKQ